MAEHTCRFQLKNELIVDVLRDNRLFNPDHYIDRARQILGRLASDAEAAAIRMIDERGAAELAQGKKAHEHDYRSDDLANLLRREQVYRAVARRLRGAMTEREGLLEHVEEARQTAWDEIASNIERQLGANSAPDLHHDPTGRAAAAVRMIALDLAELARSRRAEQRAEQDGDDQRGSCGRTTMRERSPAPSVEPGAAPPPWHMLSYLPDRASGVRYYRIDDDVGKAAMTDPQVLRHDAWTEITPDIAGWQYVHFEVRTFSAGEELVIPADGRERALVNLAGDFTANVGEQTYRFGGRASVFDGLGHTLYLPRDTDARITGTEGAELAIASAPATEAHDVRLVTPADLSVEARGAGNASRQVSTPIPPSFPADRLLVVEVWTPGGNWSSFPPHKHEHDLDGEAQLEETYYYRLRDPKRGWAIQEVYSPERDFELATQVRDGDICLLPWGYHTTVAAHGHDLYYLNVLAGPAPQRTLQAADDPDLAAIRESWQSLTVDERVPFVPQFPSSSTTTN